MTDKKDLYDVLRKVVDLIKPLSEDDKTRTIRWACEMLDINVINLGLATGIQSGISREITPVNPMQQRGYPMTFKDIKTFITEKNPVTDNHLAATVAYYYQFEATEKKDSISKDDLVDATRKIGQGGRLKRPDQTLVNATKSGYLDNISRGLYKLNSVGENLVVMTLPNTDSAVSVPKKRKKRVNKIKQPKTKTKKSRLIQ